MNPPAEIVIDQVTIENTDLHAEILGPVPEAISTSNSKLNIDSDSSGHPSTVTRAGTGVDSLSSSAPVDRKLLDLHQFNFYFKMEMVQERLAASGDLSMSPSNHVLMTSRNMVSGNSLDAVSGNSLNAISITQLKSAFKIGGKWSVDIHREGKGWLYRLETNNLKFALDDFYQGDGNSKQVSGKFEKNAKVFTQLDHAEFDLDSNSLLHSDELMQIDRSSIETMKVSLGGKTSEITKKDQAGTTLFGPLSLSFSTLLATELDFDFLLDSVKIQMPLSIPRGVSLKVKAHGSVPRTLDHLNVSSQVDLGGQRLLDSKFELERKVRELKFRSRGSLSMTAAHAKAVTAANKFASGLGLEFEMSGSRAADGNMDASFKTKVPHLVMVPIPKSSKVDVDAALRWLPATKQVLFSGKIGFVNPIDGGWIFAPDIQASLAGAMKTKGTVEISQNQKPAPLGPPLVLQMPAHVNYDLDLGSDGHAIAQVKLPSVEIPGKALLSGVEMSLHVHSPDLKAAKDLKIDFDVKQSGMKLASAYTEYTSKLPPKSLPFKEVAARGSIQLTDQRRLVVEKLTFSLNGGEVSVDGQASGDLQEKTFQAVANVAVQMRDDFPEINGQKIRGGIRVPITVTVLRARQISLIGEMVLEGVAWKKGDLSASGIEGKIPFSEKLEWDGKNIHFSTLVTQNPFERVEFDRVRPLLQGSERLRIDKVGWFEKSFGPMVGFFTVDQNMIFAHQFDMDLVSGKLYGEMFINIYPQILQYGFLARMTGLDLGEILPKKFLTRVPSGSKALSGRAGFVLDLNRNTMDGRIDVTEIGGSQLITAINVVDPVYADEKMNRVRRLLEIGYPTSVELSFADGYMDMDLGLTVLGVSSRQNVHGIRISSMLQKSTSSFIESAEKGPLK